MYRISSLFLCAIACLWMAAASAGHMYRWVDPQGRVHISQTPPPSAVTRYETIETHTPPPQAAAAQPAQAPAAPPAPDPAALARQQRCDGMHAQMSVYTHSDAPLTSELKQAMADLKAQIAKECG